MHVLNTFIYLCNVISVCLSFVSLVSINSYYISNGVQHSREHHNHIQLSTHLKLVAIHNTASCSAAVRVLSNNNHKQIYKYINHSVSELMRFSQDPGKYGSISTRWLFTLITLNTIIRAHNLCLKQASAITWARQIKTKTVRKAIWIEITTHTRTLDRTTRTRAVSPGCLLLLMAVCVSARS